MALLRSLARVSGGLLILGLICALGIVPAVRCAGISPGVFQIDGLFLGNYVKDPSIPADSYQSNAFGVAYDFHDPYLVVGALNCGLDNGCPDGAGFVFSRDSLAFTYVHQLSATLNTGDTFGWAVAASAAYAMVGAPMRNGNQAGKVLVYALNTGNGQFEYSTTLVGSDTVDGHSFGCSLAISGSTLVIGAVGIDGPNGESFSGAFYVFTLDGSTWTQQGKYQPTDVYGSYMLLSDRVLIFGDYIFATTPQRFGSSGSSGGGGNGRADGSEMVGGVVIYSGVTTNTITYSTILTPPTDDEFQIFGQDIAADDTMLYIADDFGALYFYELQESTWTLTDTMEFDDSVGLFEYGNGVYMFGFHGDLALMYKPNQIFDANEITTGPTRNIGLGTEVVFHEDRLLVSQPDCITPGGLCDGGRIYILELFDDAWAISQSLRISGQNGDVGFGTTITVLGDMIAVSAPRAKYGPYPTGIVQLYSYDSDARLYEKVISLRSRLYQLDSGFGTSIAATEGFVAVSAPTHHLNPENLNTGLVLVFKAHDSDGNWGRNGIPIQSPFLVPGEYFGWCVAFFRSSFYVLNNPGPDLGMPGLIYVHEWIDGGFQFLYPVELAPTMGLGVSISVYGDYFAVGVPGISFFGPGGGFGFVFKYIEDIDDIMPISFLFPWFITPDGYAFAYSVQMDEGGVVVGSNPCISGDCVSRGASYYFGPSDDPEVWGLKCVFSHGDDSGTDGFGYAGAATGDIIAVGSAASNFGGPNRGSVYLFDKSKCNGMLPFIGI